VTRPASRSMPAPLSFAGAARPERAPLEGERARLEPLDAGRHGRDLFAAAQGRGADPRLWDHLPYGPFPDEPAFVAWLAGLEPSEDPLFLAIVDKADGRPKGVASYLRIEPAHGTIELGHIWLGAGLQRTPAATEALFLLAAHAFEGLGNRRLEWKCDAANARSRRAAERLGYTFEGIFRQHMVVKGRNRDTAWYAILDGEWPAVRAGFERWLDPGNFDAGGRQRTPLDTGRRSAC
jgi:RimJ/RimL family protein N-acetyltransferase